MTAADLTPGMVILVIGGVFLGSFMDGIAGGGGLITLPTYLLTGLPTHIALGTNKLSSCIGTTVSTARFIKNGKVDWLPAVGSIPLALLGAHLGTRLQLQVSERWLQYLLLPVLPLVAFVVLKQKSFPEEPGQIGRRKQLAVIWAASLIIGTYDGFYGPGTGTFLLLIYCNLAKLDVRTAGGNVKVTNLCSNVAAMFTSLSQGKVFVLLGLIGAAAAVAGQYLGSGLALKNGSKIVKPVVIAVLILLAVKVVSGLIQG